MMLIVCLLVAMVGAVIPAVGAESDQDVLVQWMTGSFSSAQQAAADSAYYDIRLEMARIWDDRDDAVWIYVEQAVGSMTDKPYRQRVYRVKQIGDNLFESAVFSLPDPKACIGAWQEDAPLGDLFPADLEKREGCAVYLRREPSGEFGGGTLGRGCGSKLHGASYATSQVTVGPDRIESWDRGFDNAGQHIWGAEKGAYVFLKTAGD